MSKEVVATAPVQEGDPSGIGLDVPPDGLVSGSRHVRSGSADRPKPTPSARAMKVCFISPLGYGLYRPDVGSPYGGAELQFYLLSRELAADPRFHVSVLTTVNANPGREQCGPLTVIRRRGEGRLSMSQNRASQSCLTVFRGYGAAFREMYTLFRGIDADVYLHAGAGVEVGAYALICRLLGRKFVYVITSKADVCWPYGNVHGPLRWFFPVGLRLAHAVIARSYEQLEWLKARHGREGSLIRTAHPPSRQRLDDAAIANKQVVLWVGRIAPVKRPELFLDLASRLPDQRCVMIGMQAFGHHELFEDIRARAATLHNVTLVEDVPWSKMSGFFEQARVLVNTSEYEGFPNTFVEAAMHGTPILALAVDPDGVLEQGGIGRCATGSMEGLISLAEQLCGSVEARAQLGRRALGYALRHHDLHQTAGAVKALLRSLLGDQPTRGGTPEAP